MGAYLVGTRLSHGVGAKDQSQNLIQQKRRADLGTQKILLQDLLQLFIRYVQIQTFDNQPPVFYLAIRQQSKDLKHLIPGTRPTELQGLHTYIPLY